jgi:D-aspartate ligase
MASRVGRSEADPPAVILGGLLNALSVARSLGRAGVTVYALADAIGTSPARHSRHVAVFVEVADQDAQAGWDRWLREGPRGAVILPCSDDGLEFVARKRDDLVRLGYLPMEADDEVVLTMLDKERTYALARSFGVDVPETRTVSHVDNLREAAADIGYPCALKPLSSHRFVQRFGIKGVVVQSPRELDAALERIRPTGLAMMVTELISGVDDEYCSYYTYLDATGRPLLHFTKRKLRQYPVGFGSGCYHVTTWEPEAAEVGLHFLTRVGLRGLGNVEFKRDRRDGRLKLIECNPRFTAANELVRLAGLDLAHLAYERALGRSSGELASIFAEGVRLWHPAEDVRAFLGYRRRDGLSLGAWMGSLAHRQHLPIFSWGDPKPTLANGLVFAERVYRQLRQEALGDGRRRWAWADDGR